MPSYSEKYRACKRIGISYQKIQKYSLQNNPLPTDFMASIIKLITTKRSASQKVFLVMYDITSNKVRRLVANHLEQKGFQRVQKSVFLGSINTATYNELVADIRAINGFYENKDSFIFLPVNMSILANSHFIGRELDFQLAVNPPDCLII
jgi:CRISPR-associated protein Cas2